MNKFCPKCRMNFGETFNECPYCDGELIIQELSKSEYYDTSKSQEKHPKEKDILHMSNGELLTKYKSYLESIRNQGCDMTDEEFCDGLREGQRDKARYEYRQSQTANAALSNQSNQVHCPKCNSISITTGARGINFTWGLIGASTAVNRCANCGYTWKPKL